MEIIGIICEYNPFHNGHLYHLKKVKEMHPNSIIILVLNGYFLERGEISIVSKEDKTKLAIEYGIDIVLELPYVFGTQAADIFANRSLKMLNEFKCDYLVFGSESNDIDELNKIVNTIINDKEYDNKVKMYLDEGANYPTALAKATNSNFEFKSNDLLGISYIKSIKENNYNIKPELIKRTNDYLDIDSNEDIVSASNIREKIKNNYNIEKHVPKDVLKYINNINNDKLFELLKYKILTDKDLSIYLDVDEGIENRLIKVIEKSNNIDEFIENIKSKRYTYNKIRRMLTHILVGFTKEDNKKINLDYIKILGFSDNGRKYLNSIKKDLSIPIIVDKSSLVYKYEILASTIYSLLTNTNSKDFDKNGRPI